MRAAVAPRTLLASLLLILLAACQQVPAGSHPEHPPVPASSGSVVQDLSDLLQTTPELRDKGNRVLATQPPGSSWHGRTSADLVPYFRQWLTYVPAPDAPARYIQPWDELANSPGSEVLLGDNVFASWFVRFLDARGSFLATPESTTTLAQWMADSRVRIDEYVVPSGGFATFRDFFLRYPKPGARPLDGPGDASVVVSPADGAFRMVYAENLDSPFAVKRDVINIRQALGNDPHAEHFLGGPIVDILLWFTDYHHFHAPVSGRVVATGEYAGSYNYNFEKTNWYTGLARHRRLYYIFDTERFGLVGMIPVGFWGVGSIVSDVSAGDTVRKGDEVGHFEYGGSSIILVFEPGAVEFTFPIQEGGVPRKVKQQIGVATSR